MSKIKKHGMMVGGVMIPSAAVIAVLLWVHKVEERLTVIETQHTAMMQSLDRHYVKIEGLVKKAINGGHKHE